MNETISALSSIFTIIAILFGLWYSDIKNTLEMVMPEHYEDKKPKKKIIKRTKLYKAIPLLVINLITFVLFLPDGIHILSNSMKRYLSDTLCSYDSIKAAFIMILLLLLGLSIVLINDIRMLNKKLKE